MIINTLIIIKIMINKIIKILINKKIKMIINKMNLIIMYKKYWINKIKYKIKNNNTM